MIYAATITTAGLRLRESRLVADLLLQGISDDGWRETVVEQNILQLGSPVSVRRVSRLLRARLEPMGPDLWALVRDGHRELATQAVLAASIKDSRLLGDFIDTTLRDQRKLFAPRLAPGLWHDYLAECRGRDPDMPRWSEGTEAKLRSVVFSMLAEAGYLENTRTLALQTVFVDTQLRDYLRDRGEPYVLRCMEVAE